MICYFDTSAFVPLVIAEPSSRACLRLWTGADSVVASRMMYVEAAAALAQAERMGRLTSSSHVRALGQMDLLRSDLAFIEIDDPLCVCAAHFAHICALRGYDAMHLACIERAASPELVVVSGNKKLLDGCKQIGVATADVNSSS